MAGNVLEWIRMISGSEEIFQSNHLRSAININVLCRQGEVYPWHFDAEPYTAILYLSDSALRGWRSTPTPEQ